MNYPRHQLKRKEWQSLDGQWIMNGQTVNVPSCQIAEILEYKKVFSFKKTDDVAILHFGAADQIAKVYLNDQYVGEHIGGYLPFKFDVSKVLVEGENNLKVIVTDKLDHTYPYGKQRKDRGGMWYTPVSGLWQSVWLEQVPKRYIDDIKIKPDLSGAELEIQIIEDGKSFSRKERIEIANPVLWTPENPKLYTRAITEGDDEVEIYFALRTVDIRNINGIQRVCLNGKAVFLHGVLDQGYFNPGLFCPTSDDAYEKDVAFLKRLGFNMIRKHIKIESEEFYYQCDKQGMLVVQDMVNSGDYDFFRDTVLGTLGIRLKDKKTTDARMDFFIGHAKATINHLFNHPCIVVYTIFNEGWGQFNSDKLYDELKAQDPSRLYDSTSGWFWQEKSDFDSKHIYFRLMNLKPKHRPLFISECGGYSLNMNAQSKSYGYGKCKDKEELTLRIVELYDKMIIPAIQKGCCGCVYTQLSDIEDEINGLISYNRKEVKVIEERLLPIAEKIKTEITNV